MEKNNYDLDDKIKRAEELIAKAERGEDVSDADPRETSTEAVVLANKIYRAKGRGAIFLAQSAL